MDQLPIPIHHKSRNELLTDQEKLVKEQSSGLINSFGKLHFDSKIFVLSAAFLIGLFSSANAWRGESSDRIQFCVQTPQDTKQCRDANNRAFLMTTWHWERWEREGMPPSVKFESHIPSTNPLKPLWALSAFGSFAIASWMLRHLQDRENELQEYELIRKQRNKAEATMQAQISLMETRRQLSIAEVELQAEMEMIAGDRSVVLQQAEILAQAEVEIAKLNAQDAIFDAETAGMTDEQKQQYLALRASATQPTTSTNQQQLPTNKTDTPVLFSGDAKTNGIEITQEVLKRVASEDGSTALCGDPGTGKSTITREYIRQVHLNCPNATITVLAVKNDSFCGLREAEKVTRFTGEEAIENASDFFNGIKAVYETRLNAPECDRINFPPFVIILDDWLTISAKLNKCKDLDFDFGEILFNILIIGREYNMKFFVNLHSLNLAAIGIQELDQNTRKCLRLLLLGNRYQRNDRSLDAYGVIEQAITGQQVITHAKDKEIVREEYNRLKQISRENYQPIMFGFIGGYYLGLVPNFPPETNLFSRTSEPVTPPVYESLKSEDNAYELIQTEESLSAKLDRIFAENTPLTMSDTATKIVEIIKAGNQPVSFESIRKSRKWDANISTEQLRETLNELIIKEVITGDKETGYTII